ncbi:DUF2141 domain-containing protein [Vibrio penaeicida]|nr:DUF2141 domain-containing protein [Vibrio penaeicida]
MKAMIGLIGGLTMGPISEASGIEINVTGIDVDRGGNLIVFIFGEDGFPKIHAKALQTQTQSQLSTAMSFTFDIPQQEIAIKILHDEDEDGKVTKNWTGIYPAEGLGFSKKQKVSLTGAPVFKKSKLVRSEFESGVNIEMVYP